MTHHPAGNFKPILPLNLNDNECRGDNVTVFCFKAGKHTTSFLFAVDPSLAGGTAAEAPPPFRPSDPVLCGSCPLVTPYYCRLGDLCFVFIVRLLCFSVIDVLYVSLQYFDTVFGSFDL